MARLSVTNSRQGKDGIALYKRIASLLRTKIISGQFLQGERLPTEDEFAQQFDVSKITIRSALSFLESENLIVRKRGKGTFVSQKVNKQKQFTVLGSLPEIVLHAEKHKVRVCGIKTLTVKKTRIPNEIKKFFGFSDDDQIGLIQRVRLLENVPVYFLENYLPVNIFKNITPKELSNKTLLKILKEKIDLSVGRGEMYLQAIPADKDISEIMQCQTFDPMILREVRFWFSSGDPFEIVNTFMKPEYFRIKINIDTKGL